MVYVLKGFAAPSLLEKLTIERKPVGDAIVRRANTGMEAHQAIWNILGLTQEAREQAVSILKSAPGEGAELRERLRGALEATDDEVQALGIQMNQVYLNSTAVEAEHADEPPDFSNTNSTKEVMISTYPGHHLPHVWFAADGQPPEVSILDLAGHGKLCVFTGIGGLPRFQAAQKITSKGGIQIYECSIGYCCDYVDAYRDWIKVRSVDEDGVVLVRPDHFVAWRSRSMSTDPQVMLEAVLENILGLKV
jgi:hypothetical protein